MKINQLVAVVDQAAHLTAGEKATLLKRLARILAKLPPNETVAKALKKRG